MLITTPQGLLALPYLYEHAAVAAAAHHTSPPPPSPPSPPSPPGAEAPATIASGGTAAAPSSSAPQRQGLEPGTSGQAREDGGTASRPAWGARASLHLRVYATQAALDVARHLLQECWAADAEADAAAAAAGAAGTRLPAQGASAAVAWRSAGVCCARLAAPFGGEADLTLQVQAFGQLHWFPCLHLFPWLRRRRCAVPCCVWVDRWHMMVVVGPLTTLDGRLCSSVGRPTRPPAPQCQGPAQWTRPEVQGVFPSLSRVRAPWSRGRWDAAWRRASCPCTGRAGGPCTAARPQRRA